MNTDDVVQLLDESDEILESYVMIREIQAYLDVGYDNFHPVIRIKIWKSNATNAYYHFTVSHYVHTPLQAGPYMTSRASEDSEEAAIVSAISTTTSFLVSAISQEHEPEPSWLVPNESF